MTLALSSKVLFQLKQHIPSSDSRLNTIDRLPELELLPNWGISFIGATKENLEARIQKQIEAHYSQN